MCGRFAKQKPREFLLRFGFPDQQRPSAPLQNWPRVRSWWVGGGAGARGPCCAGPGARWAGTIGWLQDDQRRAEGLAATAYAGPSGAPLPGAGRGFYSGPRPQGGSPIILTRPRGALDLAACGTCGTTEGAASAELQQHHHPANDLVGPIHDACGDAQARGERPAGPGAPRGR